MPKTSTAALNTILANGYWRAYPLLVITPNGGSTVRYSTVPLTVGADTYVDRLKMIGPLRQSMSDVVDNVSFELWNADAVAGLVFIDPVTALDGARAEYWRWFVDPVNANNNGLLQEMVGFLRVDEGEGATDEIVSLTLVSHSNTNVASIANTQVKVACAYKFKGEFCTYAGAKTFCDKTFNGLDGCTAHFGFDQAKSRFGGHARDLDTFTVSNYQPPVPPPPPPPPLPPGQATAVFLAAQQSGFTWLTQAAVTNAWNAYNDMKMRYSQYGYRIGDFGLDFTTGRVWTGWWDNKGKYKNQIYLT